MCKPKERRKKFSILSVRTQCEVYLFQLDWQHFGSTKDSILSFYNLHIGYLDEEGSDGERERERAKNKIERTVVRLNGK